MSAADLADRIPGLIKGQRWYGGGDGDRIRVLETEVVDRPEPRLLRVVFESPDHERYQALLAVADGGEVLDALGDPDLAVRVLHAVAPTIEAHSARPVGVEQSNTSIVFDERVILKVFRRLMGTNPEVEVTTALAAAGFTQVAQPLAVWSERGDDLAIVQPFLAGGVEGWALALTSLRALLDEGGDPADSGGDFAPEAKRLGEVTADMHLRLAPALGSAPGDADAWASAMEARAAAPGVDAPGVDLEAVRARFGRLRQLGDVGLAIRIHGDLHLGQMMRTDDGWFVLDFEGEPTRPVEERRQPSSPLRDVAGMLRSFSYAAAVAVREHGGRGLGRLAASWERRNRRAFLTAYEERAVELLPARRRARGELLRAFELDKAVYEVAYEARHRPDWVGIPTAAVRRLLAP